MEIAIWTQDKYSYLQIIYINKILLVKFLAQLILWKIGNFENYFHETAWAGLSRYVKMLPRLFIFLDLTKNCWFLAGTMQCTDCWPISSTIHFLFEQLTAIYQGLCIYYLDWCINTNHQHSSSFHSTWWFCKRITLKQNEKLVFNKTDKCLFPLFKTQDKNISPHYSRKIPKGNCVPSHILFTIFHFEYTTEPF